MDPNDQNGQNPIDGGQAPMPGTDTPVPQGDTSMPSTPPPTGDMGGDAEPEIAPPTPAPDEGGPMGGGDSSTGTPA